MIRVVLADDNLLVREGVQRMLDRAPELEVVAVCGDRDSLLEAVERERPDVVVTDIRMPPTLNDEGIQVANLLRDSHPELGVIVLSQYGDAAYVLSMLERGSARRGYLLKERLAAREQLVAGITEVAAGGSVIDAEVVDALVSGRKQGEESPLWHLTPREYQVLAEIAAGKSNSAIARSLVITKRAVERHIGSIFAKLDLPAEGEVSRRVSATLLFLADRQDGTAPRSTPPG
jgi:DNA-binding NarL/FixJ family response regulator